MAWLLLFAAIFFEIVATIQLKLSDGLARWDSSISTMLFFGLSFLCASFALKKIDMGLAYSLWAGLSTVGVITAGILYFGESSNLIKIGFASLIMIGIIGLNLNS